MAYKSESAGTISVKPTQKQKKWMLEREQAEARADLKIFKRDFFENLPGEVCRILDSLIWRWRAYDWFEEAWNKYRDHVLEAIEKGGKVKVPGYVFNDYINEQVKKDFDRREELALCHSDVDIDEYLEHYGIKGQRWGSRRYQNPDGTLTEAGKIRYLKGYDPNKPDSEKNAQFDYDKYDNDIRNQANAEAGMVKALGNAATEAGNTINTNKGSKVVNKKDYSKIPDDEMRRRINRLSMERQYGDLTGDNQYKMTGKEKAKEVLQTIGSVLGIAASAITVGLLYKQYKGGYQTPVKKP